MGALERVGNGALSSRERQTRAEIIGMPPLSRGVERAVTHEVGVAYGRGIVGAARIEALHTAAWHALRALRDLESEEDDAVRRNPLREGYRQRMIVDSAALAMDDVVRSVGRNY